MRKINSARKLLAALALIGLAAPALSSASGYTFRVTLRGLKPVNPSPAWAVTGSPSTAFSSALVGSFASPDLTLPIQNNGGAGSLGSLAVAGTNAGDFSASHNCTNIAANATCAVFVRFKPTASGSRSASLSIGGTGLALTGMGTAPVNVSFSPTGTGYSGTIQNWTVPTTGTYSVTLAGAAGGAETADNRAGGKGAILAVRLSLTQGTVLAVLVGQTGATGANIAGGGGGSYIVNGSTLLAVAGGGGGGGNSGGPGYDASLTTALTAHYSAGTGSNGWGGGGAGFNSNGYDDTNYGGQSLSFTNGGGGGGTSANSCNTAAPGGFGGGGGGGCNGGGSGGGYSNSFQGSAGGNSYYTGTFVSATASNSGAGSVNFTLN